MKKKFYIDGYFLSQRVTGVQRYAEEVISSLLQRGHEVIVLAPKNTSRNINGAKVIQNKLFQGLFWQQVILPIQLIFLGCPLITSLSGLGPVLYPYKLLTIHDGSLYRYPEYFSLLYRLIYKTLYPVSVFLSKGIITVSEFSKKEIFRYIGKRKEVYVVNNVVSSFNLLEASENDFTHHKPYILTVGSLDKRKNLNAIIEAFKDFNINGQYKLLIAGGSARSFSGSQIKSETLDSDIMYLGYVQDSELADLYRNAEFFVYMSLYEGFGIPPLEALSYDCPVLLSDIEVFREIYGANFTFVDPTQVNSIAHAMKVFSSLNRKELLAKQKPIISNYTKLVQAQQFEEIIYECKREKN